MAKEKKTRGVQAGNDIATWLVGVWPDQHIHYQKVCLRIEVDSVKLVFDWSPGKLNSNHCHVI
jgi:hypothetical protein